jgi:hypothetical protein
VSLAGPSFTEPVIVRSADAEVVGWAPTAIRLHAIERYGEHAVSPGHLG